MSVPFSSTQKYTVHQYHDSVQPNDAISNQMQFLQDSLKRMGIGGEIYARQIKPSSWDKARLFSPSAVWNCDLMLVHHSQGSPWLGEVLKIEVPKALVYHNITPSHFFRHDPYLSNLCILGRRQLLHLRGEVIATFAASQFNASELEILGYPKARVLPLMNLTLAEKPAPKKDRTARRFLFVGKLTPHKNQALVIKAFYYLKKLQRGKSYLYLVGGEDPIYGHYLRLLARALGIADSVIFTGKLSQADLDIQYRLADAFLCMSLHEGFCLPLVEAMRSGTPVFALPCGSIPETLGRAGILLRTRRPHRLAEVISAVLGDSAAVRVVIEGQQRRLRELAEEQCTLKAQTVIGDVLRSLRHAPPVSPHKETISDVHV